MNHPHDDLEDRRTQESRGVPEYPDPPDPPHIWIVETEGQIFLMCDDCGPERHAKRVTAAAVIKLYLADGDSCDVCGRNVRGE